MSEATSQVLYYELSGPYPKTNAAIEHGLYNLPYVTKVTLGGRKVAIEVNSYENPMALDPDIAAVMFEASGHYTRMVEISGGVDSVLKGEPLKIPSENIKTWAYRANNLDIELFTGLKIKIECDEPITVDYREYENAR